ncbi:MAG: class I SAM-dependent methyltransferase [Anaerolineales bacterium]|nr:class I SAM-dependent methyltransferase [Anaerolineales bacterium]
MGTAQIQGELWGQSPQGWAEVHEPQSHPLWEVMLDKTGVVAGSRFLDAGCGAGSLSLMAANRGALVSGLDAADGLLSYARSRVPAGEFRQGDIEQLPFADNSFDAVIASNSVQYAADRIATLRELRRVCRPNGTISACLFGPPERVAYTALFQALAATMPQKPQGGGPFELSAPGVFTALFEEAGLTVIERDEIDLYFRYPDFDTFWYANMSSGPFQGISRAVPEDKMRTAVAAVMDPFIASDGSVNLGPNAWAYVIAKP